VSTRRGVLTVNAWVTDRVKPGKIWMPFHFAEQPANALTVDAFDNITRTAEYKVCAAAVEPVVLKAGHVRGAAFAAPSG
jgi:predicted molibdopterin-dependent oxidoreductase YjgC